MFRVQRHKEVTSTNELVKAAIANGEPEGLVVVGDVQTAGYGRRGNKWESQAGGLYMSLLLRPEVDIERLQTISLTTAIAVRRALSSFMAAEGAADIRIKWPNDVVYMPHGEYGGKFQKLCGISVEQKDGAVCVGIGVNVFDPASFANANPDAMALEGDRNKITYIADIAGSDVTIDEVRDRILDEYDDVYAVWKSYGFEAFRKEFMDNFALEGFKICISQTDDSKPVECHVEDVNESGHLLVVPIGDDEVHEIVAGSITIID